MVTNLSTLVSFYADKNKNKSTTYLKKLQNVISAEDIEMEEIKEESEKWQKLLLTFILVQSFFRKKLHILCIDIAVLIIQKQFTNYHTPILLHPFPQNSKHFSFFASSSYFLLSSIILFSHSAYAFDRYFSFYPISFFDSLILICSLSKSFVNLLFLAYLNNN